MKGIILAGGSGDKALSVDDFRQQTVDAGV